MGWHDQLTGLFVLFTVVNTTTVGLRVFTRTKLTKGAFGWDDIALIFTHDLLTKEFKVGMLAIVGLSLRSIHYGNLKDATDEKPWYDETKAATYYFAMSVVCFVIAGTVKISVALVLYRLDSRPLIRAVIASDIVTCCIWTLSSTLLLSLFCMSESLYPGSLDKTTCRNITYSQQSLYIIYDAFHITLPVFILWNVQISRTLKWSVVGLFSIGLLATTAAAMKLKTTYDIYNLQDSIDFIAREYNVLIWSTLEHGLSIFASSLLALRPLMRLVPHGWTTLLDTLHTRGSANSSGQGSSRQTPKKSSWSNTTELDELGSFGAKDSVSSRTKHVVGYHA